MNFLRQYNNYCRLFPNTFFHCSLPLNCSCQLRTDRLQKFPTSSADSNIATTPAAAVTLEAHKCKIKLAPEDGIDNTKLLRVAIIGVPNSGKSVLTNALVGSKVCSVSKKVHTTRRMMRAITVHSATQLIFLDSPGVITPGHKRKHNLEDELLTDPERCLTEADQIVVLVDASQPLQRLALHPRLLYLLYRYQTLPSVLVLNKIDLVKPKSKLLEMVNILTNGIFCGKEIQRKPTKFLVANLGHQSSNAVKRTMIDPLKQTKSEQQADDGQSKGGFEQRLQQILKCPTHEVLQSQLNRCFGDVKGWPKFERVFMISAHDGNGVTDLKEYLLENAKDSRWRFHSSVITDCDPVTLVLDTVRAQLLNCLPNIIPYRLNLKLCEWNVNEHGVLGIRVDIICEKFGIGKLVIGAAGRKINETSKAACQILRDVFQRDIHLRLGVSSPKPPQKTPLPAAPENEQLLDVATSDAQLINAANKRLVKITKGYKRLKHRKT